MLNKQYFFSMKSHVLIFQWPTDFHAIFFNFRETDIRPGLRDPEDKEELLTITARHHPLQATDVQGFRGPQPQV